LDEQALIGHVSQLIGVKALVSLGQQQESLSIWDHPGSSPAGLIQQGFATGKSAELLGPVVAGNLAS